MKKSESYPFFHEIIEKKRAHPCTCCGEERGSVISKINYIGLMDVDFVQCKNCELTSFDPVPNSEVTTKGCTLLYATQQQETKKKKILRGFGRSYRRGGRFARKYLQGKLNLNRNQELSILEVGAGDGYFSQGILSEFNGGNATYIDIVPDLKNYYDSHFKNHKAIVGEFNHEVVDEGSVDLIIIRDLLEHLRDPNQFLADAYKVLKPGGFLFLITPNGWEDAWPAYQYATFRDLAKLSENPFIIHLNHFHYFMPKTLKQLLKQNNFHVRIGFKYGLKRFKEGSGVKKVNCPDMERPTWDNLDLDQSSFIDHWQHDPSFINKEWLHNNGTISKIYSSITDREKEVVDFDDPRGHEFFVISQKQ